RILPAVPGPVPYFVPPAGERTLRDVFERSDGAMLGQGWSRLERVGSRPFRWARPGAELVVIPRGERSELEITAEAGPGCGGADPTIDVVDESGRVTVSLPLAPQGESRLTIPVPPDRVASVRLRFRLAAAANESGGGDERKFRIFGRGPVDGEIDNP